MEDKKENEKQESKESGEGDKPTTTPIIESANATAERLEAANKKQEELQIRQAELQADAKFGGGSVAGQGEPTPKKMTDIEYAEALSRGEVNPMKEDGFA